MKTKITKEQAIKAGNDGRNQDIKQKFVASHVFCNVGSLIEYCLSKGFEDNESPVSLDSIENYYSVNTESLINDILSNWNGMQTEFTEYANESTAYNRRVKTKGDFEVFLNSLDNDELEEFANEFDYEFPESEPAEIYEWWTVSDYLYEQLKERGYCVADTGSCYVWGRTTTGQAILLDHVITLICADMEILEGQSNAWL